LSLYGLCFSAKKNKKEVQKEREKKASVQNRGERENTGEIICLLG